MHSYISNDCSYVFESVFIYFECLSIYSERFSYIEPVFIYFGKRILIFWKMYSYISESVFLSFEKCIHIFQTCLYLLREAYSYILKYIYSIWTSAHIFWTYFEQITNLLACFQQWFLFSARWRTPLIVRFPSHGEFNDRLCRFLLHRCAVSLITYKYIYIYIFIYIWEESHNPFRMGRLHATETWNPS